MLVKQFHMTQRSFPSRVSRWTKILHRLESDKASRNDEGRAAQKGKIGVYLGKRLELGNRGRSGNVDERRNARNSKEERSVRRPDGAVREERGEGKDGAGCGDSRRRGQKTGGW